MIVAVDPGLYKAGVAWTDKPGGVIQAATVRIPRATGRGAPAWNALSKAVLAKVPGTIDALVVEVMQVYEGRARKGRPADLLELQGMAGCVTGRADAPRMETVLPRVWTSSVPKRVRHQRLRADKALKSRLKTKLLAKDHDAWDAVGLLLWYEERLE